MRSTCFLFDARSVNAAANYLAATFFFIERLDFLAFLVILAGLAAASAAGMAAAAGVAPVEGAAAACEAACALTPKEATAATRRALRILFMMMTFWLMRQVRKTQNHCWLVTIKHLQVVPACGVAEATDTIPTMQTLQ